MQRPDPFRRIFWVIATVHIALVIGVMLYSVVKQWWLRTRKPETITFVSLYSPPAPETAAAVEAPAPAPEPPPPAPTPTPRPQIQRSTERVRRDAPPPAQPALTPEQIRQQLEQAVPTTTQRPGPAATDNISRYYALIDQTFRRAWEQPSAVLPGTIVQARIRIQRDGTVTQRELIRRSGNPTMDDSVQRALQSVSRIAPLPSEISGPHHDFTIEFELTGAL